MSKSDKIIVSFNGFEGSGKSTVAKMISEEFSLPRYYMGQIFRDMAEEKGMELPEFRKLCDNDPDFDKKVDDYVVRLAKEHDKFVIESRTAWHFIPDSIKIYLKVDPDVAAKRIFLSLSTERGRLNEDSDLNSVEKIKSSLIRRRKEDSLRYLSFYGIRQDEENNYDFVIDTTELTIDEVFTKVKSFIESKING